MKALITGAAGFVGPYVSEVLVRNGVECVGFARPTDTGFERLPKEVKICFGDIRDAGAVGDCLREHRPELVVHLAAMTSVPASFEHPGVTFDINVNGTLNLLECIRKSDIRPRILNVSTSLLYGSEGSGSSGFQESDPWHPNSPYATSKAMGELACAEYFRSFGLDIVTARPFNHVGPGQTPDFVCSDFARQIALIMAGKRDNEMRVGNLAPVRDFTDVRDIAQAYYCLLRAGRSGEAYNVCSGHLHAIAEILDCLIKLSGIQVRVTRDEARLRPAEVIRTTGDASKLRRETGWQAVIPLAETMELVLRDWVAAVR